MKPRVVFDTNIFVSAIIFGGNPRVCLEMARTGEIRLFTSKAILVELSKNLHTKFYWTPQDIKEVIVGIARFAKIVIPRERVTMIKDDVSDNIILAAAIEAGVDFIISGDKKHILPLKSFQKIKILTPAEFLKQV